MKRCPNCNSHTVTSRDSFKESAHYSQVYCAQCGAAGPIHRSLGEAIALWDSLPRRKATPRLEKLLRRLPEQTDIFISVSLKGAKDDKVFLDLIAFKEWLMALPERTHPDD